MKQILRSLGFVAGCTFFCTLATAATNLTVYNQDFAVVRENLPLDLKIGVNEVRFSEASVHLEPDTVILRDPAGKHAFQILEQNFRGDPISQGLLLNLYEGKEVDFLVRSPDGHTKTVRGKIVRSGYVVHSQGLRRYGQDYYQTQAAYAYAPGQAITPVVLVDGKLQFSLPGEPLFPELTDEAILRPTLVWKIESAGAARFDAELAYVTGGMSWDADYNVISPEKQDELDLSGWVTLDNQSGRSYNDARIKLMAGDVNKLRREGMLRAGFGGGGAMAGDALGPTVQEKAFDEYHLYTIERSTTLRDRETKQVEFVRAAGIRSNRLYVYDGLERDPRYTDYYSIRNTADYGTRSNPKVWVMREIANTKENHLGIALPKGRVRFYRRSDDASLEFIGENTIDHTPRDEKLRIYTGNAFDIVGERIQTDYQRDDNLAEVDESFKIVIRNHKAQAAEIRVVEHLYRWSSWEIRDASQDYRKVDSRTIEFTVNVPPDGEQAVTYTAHYFWRASEMGNTPRPPRPPRPRR